MFIARLAIWNDLEPRPAAENMALDEALLGAGMSDPWLRVYRWKCPAVSFGYFEAYPPIEEAFPTREKVRRWTGGGVVLHGEDWTYSLGVPRGHPFLEIRPSESYRYLHHELSTALQEALGSGEFSLTGEVKAKISQSCFENPVEHDLLLGGEKIAGAAQKRSRFGLLHQGSVQGKGLRFPDGLAAVFARRISLEQTVLTPSSGVFAAAKELAATKYGNPAWNERI